MPETLPLINNSTTDLKSLGRISLEKLGYSLKVLPHGKDDK